jgi:hypothetical protein
MIDLNAIGRYVLPVSFILACLYAGHLAAKNADLEARLETRTESYRACMGVES